MNKLLSYTGIALIIIGAIIIILSLNASYNCPPSINGTIASGCNNSVVAFPLYVGIGFIVVGVVLLVISFTIKKSAKTLTSHQERPSIPKE